MKIAFLGLGAMGAPMAENLLKAGYYVRTAIHHKRGAAEGLQRRLGLDIAPSMQEAVKGVDVIITMLPADSEVNTVLLDPNMVKEVPAGTVILEMSSCSATTIREISAFYEKRGVSIVDAPVSGGVKGAVAAGLTVFLSGPPAAKKQVLPILNVLAETIYDLGECGMGKTIKNLDNLLSMYNLMGVCEAYHIVKNQNIDADLFFNIISKNSGSSRALNNRWFDLVNSNFTPGFTLRLARKDVKNALSMGDGVPLPMFSLLYSLMMAGRKYDEEDVNALRKIFE